MKFCASCWIPAFAGMTVLKACRHARGSGHPDMLLKWLLIRDHLTPLREITAVSSVCKDHICRGGVYPRPQAHIRPAEPCLTFFQADFALP